MGMEKREDARKRGKKQAEEEQIKSLIYPKVRQIAKAKLRGDRTLNG